jgi:hypothetical protein
MQIARARFWAMPLGASARSGQSQRWR